MPSGDACLLDSNILLRIGKNDDPQHAAISHALHVLVGQGIRLCYTSQYSILVYRLTDADVALAIEGPPCELLEKPEWRLEDERLGRTKHSGH